jgi:hypothetical protein
MTMVAEATRADTERSEDCMMKRGRLSLVIAAFAVPGLGLGLALGLGASASASPAARAGTSTFSEQTVVVNCLSKPQVRPGSFTLACADGDDYLTGLSWTSWTPHLASGYGTEKVNDCNPYCAAGQFHSYPVLVVFWGNTGLHGHPGTQRYTNVTLLYPGTRPPAFNGHRWVQGPATVGRSLWA